MFSKNKKIKPTLQPLEVTLEQINEHKQQTKQIIASNKLIDIMRHMMFTLQPLSYQYPSQDYYQLFLALKPVLEEFHQFICNIDLDLNVITTFIYPIKDAVVRCYLLIDVAITSIMRGEHQTNRGLNALLVIVKSIAFPLQRIFALNRLFVLSLPLIEKKSEIAVPFILSHTTIVLHALSHVTNSENLLLEQVTPLSTFALRPIRYLSTLNVEENIFRSFLITLQRTLINCSTVTQEFFYLMLVQVFPIHIQLHCMPEILAGMTSPLCHIDLKLCLAPFLDKLPNIPKEYHVDVLDSIQMKVVHMVQSGMTPANDGGLLLVSIIRIIFSWYNAGSFIEQLESIFKCFLLILENANPSSLQFHICMGMELILKTIPVMNTIKMEGFLDLLNYLFPQNKKKVARLVIECIQHQNVILRSYKDASYILDMVDLMLHPDKNDLDAQNDLSMSLSLFTRIKIQGTSSCALTLSLLDKYVDLSLGEVPLKLVAEVELRLIIKSKVALERDLLFERFLNRIRNLVKTNAPLAIGLALQALLCGVKANYQHCLYFFEFAVGETELIEDDFIKAECLEKIIGTTHLLDKRKEYNDMVLLLTKHAKSIINRPKRCKEILQVIHLWKEGNDEMIKQCIRVLLESSKECEIECGERLRIEAVNHLICCVVKGTFADKEFVKEVYQIADVHLLTIFPQTVLNSFYNAKKKLEELNII